MKKVVIIVSVYNEETNIKILYDSVIKHIDKNKYDFDICFIDDGSNDNSLNIIKDIKSKDNKVEYKKFKRNYGHETAMIAGVDLNEGYDYYIIMDCDMQHPPEYIMDMVNAMDGGFDAVFMKRINNDSRSAITSLFSALYYDLFNFMFNENFIKSASDFMGFNNDIAEILRRKYRYKNRLLRYITQKISKNKKILEYIPVKRYSGESKYSFIKYCLLALQSVKSMSLVKHNSNLNDLYYEVEE